ncbi:MAG TPA: Crp/Fnr family transcriptional regulator [Xanthomonadales bacterium]|nr:Crp/Fnr family transcriptional regulator [Xanthomonadales bacterium]
MPTSPAVVVVNRLIEGLPPATRRTFLSHCTIQQLVCGEVLCSPEKPFQHVHFPLTGYIALTVPSDGHQPAALSMIGNEGVLGATLALGTDAAPLCGLVIGAGTALRMTATQFHRQLEQSAGLNRALRDYLYVQVEQLAQTVACNTFHEVIARLARWLLITHDRAHGQPISLTHQSFANLLGVRRSAITIAAGELQKRKCIRYARGRIRIVSRPRIEAIACGCYLAGIRSYSRRFPAPPAPGMAAKTGSW